MMRYERVTRADLNWLSEGMDEADDGEWVRDKDIKNLLIAQCGTTYCFDGPVCPVHGNTLMCIRKRGVSLSSGDTP